MTRKVIYEIGDGWMPLVKPLVEEILSSGGTIHQVKEKFGGLRVYASCSEELQEKITALCNVCAKTCEECGQPAELSLAASSWWVTLCNKHLIERNIRLPGLPTE